VVRRLGVFFTFTTLPVQPFCAPSSPPNSLYARAGRFAVNAPADCLMLFSARLETLQSVAAF
jgi:hypothetical protein